MTNAIFIIANTMIEPGMSGGNRIFIEFAKHWVKAGHRVTVFTSQTGQQICQANGLMGARYITWPAERFSYLGIFGQYIIGVFYGMWNALKMVVGEKGRIIWSSSDFWPDSIPGFFMRFFGWRSFWISSIFMFAPRPQARKGESSWKVRLHFLTQKPIFWMSRKVAHMIFVTNDGDREFVIQSGVEPERVVAIRGGVDLEHIESITATAKKYAGCFMGRLHRHKGILGLIHVWKEVCQVRPDAKLAIVGEGPQRHEVEELIRQEGLGNHVILFGFVDGDYKYIIMKESKLFLHSSVWDSGGMSAAEGMACGLPVVGYDLPAFETYYPQGMLKAPLNDQHAYARCILQLLDDHALYEKMSATARAWATGWDWSVNARRVMAAIDEVREKR